MVEDRLLIWTRWLVNRRRTSCDIFKSNSDTSTNSGSYSYTYTYADSDTKWQWY